jgi:hypothetical protein
MSSKPRRVGYLLIDHKFSPGLTPLEAHQSGMSGLPVGAGKLFEADTLTCRHCTGVVILNPLRTRERTYCPKCDQYICDGCAGIMAASGKCISIDRLFDFVQSANARAEDCGEKAMGLPDLSPLYNTVSASVPESPPIGD